MVDKDDFEFARNMKTVQSYKREREEKFKQFSNTRLYDICRKKINTTMIGAIATVEKYFGPLIEAGDKQAKRAFEDARSEILDKGNAQIRNLESEFNQYDIVWKKNNIVMPILEQK